MPVLPNAENLMSSFLRHDPAVLATALGDNTYTETPRNPTFPLCRVTRVGGLPEDSNLLLDFPLMQVDVWGGPKTEAEKIAATIRDALSARLPYRGKAGALLAAVRFGGLRYLPDTDFDPARPRYTFDVEVKNRP